MKKILAFLLLNALAVLAQIGAQLNGTVVDPQGAVVPGARVDVLNVDTGQVLKTNTNDRGEWLLAGMTAATYRITVTAPGFARATLENAVMHAGVPLTVNAKLEVGSTSESVVVTSSAELVQTTNATVSTTVQTKQVMDLPYISRGGMDLFVTQPGVQTTGTNRTSFINGLPLAAINVTIDGINTQDNYYKNGDGFFTVIPARQDSLQEITLTTAAGGADANSQGAATVRFVTKSGTNSYHGGVFYQHRNTWLNANSYFNNINGQARNRMIIHQGGANVGGPILKNKLLFFTNLEIFRYPATSSLSRVVMNPSAMDGTYTYPVSGGTNKINVLTMAGAAGFNTTTDPIIFQTLKQISGYSANGTLQDRITSNSDYNRSNLLFSPKGSSNYWTDTTRLDYNISDKHTLSAVYTYFKLTGKGDVTNGVFNIFPGTGAIVGQDNLFVTQSGNRYALSVALRSSLTARLTNELRFGVNRAISMFRPEISSGAQFGEWRGYAPSLGFSLTGVASVTSSSRRSSPVRELHDTVSMQKGSHTLSFGADASQINLWYVTSGNSVIPTISFGAATGDPVVTGSTNLFTAASMPGSTPTYQGEAAALYALLTGRVSSIGRSVAYDGQSYKAISPTDRDRQYEYGFFAQDSWRAAPSLTVTLGLRFERQQPFQNLDNAYSSVSYASLWGVSGIGNLFNPNAKGGVNPTFDKYNSSYYQAPSFWNPSVGLAWQLPEMKGALGSLFGRERGKSVLRAGYAINTVRNGSNTFQSLLGSNQGLNYDTTVNPGSYPADFGPAGSVLFRQANLPVRSGVPNAPQYPILPSTTNSLNGYDPGLKMAYVQSWNIGFQRELSRNMVMEVRYTGNHGLKAWRQMNLNEINTFENGFQKEFYTAQQNLFINRGCSGSWNNCSNPNSNSFANAGLPGQGAIPIISTALGTTTDSSTATSLRRNQPSALASSYATNATYNAHLIAAGYPSNFFLVNPAVSSGGSWLLTNGGSSSYNALQVEVNRHMASGLLMQMSYVWSKSLVNGSQSSLVDASQPTTFRNLGLDKQPGGYDIRHAIKINSIYELPVGAGRHFLATTPVLKKVLEGWEISGISRVQSGAPMQMTSGRSGLNGQEAGTVLMNMSLAQLQNMVQLRKITPAPTTAGVTPIGQVMWLPDTLIANTNAAFETNGKTWSDLNTSQPYISPQLAPGSFGYEIFIRQPWQYHLDMALLKRTTIKERFNTELQVNFMDILNLTNFYLQNAPSSTSFGRTTSTYNDLSGNYDPGARVIEFRLRVSF